MWTLLKAWASRLRRDVGALYLAAQDARTPTVAKVAALAVVVYALSPIDLIPDFVPVLGYLDDLLIVPLGIWLAVRLVPPALMQDFRSEALRQGRMPASRAGAVLVIAIWTAVGAAVLYWML